MNQLLKEKIKDKLNSFSNIHIGIVFGSYAKDCNRSGSDLDIAVAADKSMANQEMAHIKAQLNIALDKDIDLIDLNSVRGLILREALCEGEVILKKDILLLNSLLFKFLLELMNRLSVMYKKTTTETL